MKRAEKGRRVLAILDELCPAPSVRFLGVAGLFATDLRELGPEAVPAGAVLLCSPLVSAIGTTYVKKHGAGTSCANLAQYTQGFLDQMTTMRSAVTVVCYTMYTVAYDTYAKFGADQHLLYSAPFVVFGLARYLLLVSTRKGGGSPTRVLLGGDAPFVANAVAWLGVVLAVVFGRW